MTDYTNNKNESNFMFKKYKITDYNNALQDYSYLPDKLQNCSDEDLVLSAEFLTITCTMIGMCHENIKSKKYQHLHMYNTENVVPIPVGMPNAVVNIDQPYNDTQTHVGIMLGGFCRCELVSYKIKDQAGDTIKMFAIHTNDQMCGGLPTTYFYFK
tara:strand:- start:62 stop:529 length:468 start_codon:yes stop_codon:yes gene_type:complete